MILQHFSDRPVPLKQMYNVSVGFQPVNSEDGKPKGLWVSVKGPYDWHHWCKSSDFRIDRLAVCHRVEIDFTNILIIDTEEKLKGFDHRYHVWSNWCGNGINWSRVASDYSGIIIAPYFCNLRLVIDWYYGWDCASGCIWFAKDVVKWIGAEVFCKNHGVDGIDAYIEEPCGFYERDELI
jgi:hypothetical protein